MKALLDAAEPDTTEPRLLIPPYLDSEKIVEQSGVASDITELSGETMGTYWTLKLQLPVDVLPKGIRKGVIERLNIINQQMSHWDPNSELSKFNSAAPNTPVILSKEFFVVLKRSLEIAKITRGVYAPTMGALVGLNGFGPYPCEEPTQNRTQKNLRSNSWRKIILDDETRSAQHSGNCQLDLSSIAKGYAIDFVCEYLERERMTNYLFEIGGEFRGNGCKPNHQPWWVELEPLKAVDVLPAKIFIAVCGVSVATSGASVQSHEKEGIIFHHLISPQTGLPTAHSLVAVSVITDSCMEADAWATALFLLGAQKALKLAEEQNLAACLMSVEDGEVKEVVSTQYELLEK